MYLSAGQLSVAYDTNRSCAKLGSWSCATESFISAFRHPSHSVGGACMHQAIPSHQRHRQVGCMHRPVRAVSAEGRASRSQICHEAKPCVLLGLTGRQLSSKRAGDPGTRAVQKRPAWKCMRVSSVNSTEARGHGGNYTPELPTQPAPKALPGTTQQASVSGSLEPTLFGVDR